MFIPDTLRGCMIEGRKYPGYCPESIWLQLKNPWQRKKNCFTNTGIKEIQKAIYKMFVPAQIVLFYQKNITQSKLLNAQW